MFLHINECHRHPPKRINLTFFFTGKMNTNSYIKTDLKIHSPPKWHPSSLGDPNNPYSILSDTEDTGTEKEKILENANDDKEPAAMSPLQCQKKQKLLLQQQKPQILRGVSSF